MERRPSDWKIGSDHVVLLLLLCTSLTLNVYLGIRARESFHKSAAWGLARPLLRSGDTVGKIRAIQLGATRQAVELSLEEPTVLYLFRPSCPWCRVNAEAMTALYAQAHQEYRFLALSTESAGVDEFVKHHPSAIPTFLLSEQESTRIGQRVGGLPATLVVKKGAVAQLWTGAYTGETKRGIELAFSVSLPPVRPPRAQ